jgi:mannose-6-phosphate isomerase-like protein (cupin superfamily)
MYKLVKAADATVRQIADNKIASNFITKDMNPGISFATTEAIDYYEKETTPYTRIYYVLKGTMVITINNENLKVEAGDVCYIEKNNTYEMQGTFKAVIVNQPAFGS